MGPQPPTRSGRTCRRAASSSCSRSSSTCTRGRARSSCRSARARHLTGSSETARASPASPRARSARCRAIPTSRPFRISTATRPSLAGEPRALRLRRHGRGRGVGVLPAHDPPPRARPGEGARIRVPDGPRARVLPRQAARGRLDRDRGRVRHAREAVLRHGGPHASLRLPDHGLAVLQRARVGELRERPRGRERPVRAELHLRRCARLVRPRDLLPLHGSHAGGAGRDDRDVHAEAVLAPDGERLPLPHVALGRGHEPVPRRVGSARARALGHRVPLHRRACARTLVRTAA